MHPLKKVESLSKGASYYPTRKLPFKAAPSKIRVKDRGLGKVTIRVGLAADYLRNKPL